MAPPAEGECDILNLVLGPVHLDLLGLVVNLDDCAGGPVTVDITAIEGGGLLGDLLCSVAGLLDSGADLGAILEGLTDDELALLNGGIRDVLNSILGELLATDATAAGMPPINMPDPGTCAIFSPSKFRKDLPLMFSAFWSKPVPFASMFTPSGKRKLVG